MPILAREADLYPEYLLENETLGEEEDNCWWVLYTRSRYEKETMRRLRSLDVPFYSPLVEKRMRSPNGRTRTSYVPLFSNYVFIYGDEFSRYRALTTNCISRTLKVTDGPRLTHDLRQIHHLIESGIPLSIEAQLQPGARVRIRSGALKGQEGVVIHRRGERRLLVTVDFLQQGASVLLEDFEVEPLG